MVFMDGRYVKKRVAFQQQWGARRGKIKEHTDLQTVFPFLARVSDCSWAILTKSLRSEFISCALICCDEETNVDEIKS